MADHTNTILYGPPGTGKTYRSAAEALRICDGNVPSDRSTVMTRYQELRNEGRIEFVTFHQSYGYEDFVEGIRPVLSEVDTGASHDSEADAGETTSGVRYECRDGIFKRLCSAARAMTTGQAVPFAFDPSATKCWKMSLGEAANPDHAEIYDECIELGQVLLGYGGQIDFASCDTRASIETRLLEERPDAKRGGSTVGFIHAFKNLMTVGDLVVVTEGNRKFRAIGRVSGEYQVIDRHEYAQMRPVEWLAVYEDSLPVERILTNSFVQRSLYRL